MKLFRPKYESDPRWQRDQWRALNPEAAQIYRSVIAIRSIISQVTEEAVAGLGKVTPGSDSLANLKGEVRFRLNEVGKDLAAAKVLLEAGENSPQFKRAEKEFRPLLESQNCVNLPRKKCDKSGNGPNRLYFKLVNPQRRSP